MDQLKNQPCPVCGKKSLTLTEDAIDDPYFGKLFVFSMKCDSCDFLKADIEPETEHEPVKFTFEVSSEEDLNVRIVKSSAATVKIPHLTTIEPGSQSEGYVTNVEGLLNRVKAVIQSVADTEDDATLRKKAKKQLKKLNNVLLGRDKLKIIIEDPSGNSAIISEKAVKSKL